MEKQLKLNLNENDIEMFCPSCWVEETFTEMSEFSEKSVCPVYVCCACGFPVHVERGEYNVEDTDREGTA